MLMTPGLIEKLRRPLYAEAVTILSASRFGDRLLQVRVSSPVLASGYHGQQEIVVEGAGVRFKKEVDV